MLRAVAAAGWLTALASGVAPPKRVVGLHQLEPEPSPAPLVASPDPSRPSVPITQPKAALFSAVDCIRYIIVNGSDAEAAFREQMEQLDLWSRVVVQVEPVDLDGKTAGAFSAHQSAWQAGLKAGCKNLMVLEEDTAFDPQAMHPAAENLNKFLEHKADEYDMTLLGWGPSFLFTGHVGLVSFQNTPFNKTLPCVYEIHHWLLMHAYVISPTAMKKYVRLQYNTTATGAPKGLPIDNLISMKNDDNRFFAIYPMLAYQSDHVLRSQGRQGQAEITNQQHELLDEVMAIPGDIHFIENELYKKSGIVPPTSCDPTLVAHPQPLYTPYGIVLPKITTKSGIVLPKNTTNVNPLMAQPGSLR